MEVPGDEEGGWERRVSDNGADSQGLIVAGNREGDDAMGMLDMRAQWVWQAGWARVEVVIGDIAWQGEAQVGLPAGGFKRHVACISGDGVY